MTGKQTYEGVSPPLKLNFGRPILSQPPLKLVPFLFRYFPGICKKLLDELKLLGKIIILLIRTVGT